MKGPVNMRNDTSRMQRCVLSARLCESKRWILQGRRERTMKGKLVTARRFR